MDALLALKARRSVGSYKPDPVPPKIVEDIVDCGLLAVTALNLQPWEFVVAAEMESRRQLAEMIDTGRFIGEAPVCVAVFCRDTKYYLEDGSAAIQNMLVAARAHGLGSCWVAGDKKPYFARVGEMLGMALQTHRAGCVGLFHRTTLVATQEIALRSAALGEVLAEVQGRFYVIGHADDRSGR